MKIKLFILFTLLSFCFSCGKSETELSGEVFVVTKGAGTYKLGLVEVTAIPEKEIKEYLAVREKQQTILKSKADQWSADYTALASETNRTGFLAAKIELDQFNSKEVIFYGLPKTSISTKTNADGKFSLKLPSGKYLITARATREATEKEEYFWCVWINAESKTQSIMLSNDNMTDAISIDSALRAGMK